MVHAIKQDLTPSFCADGATDYFSPKAQKQLHEKYPDEYTTIKPAFADKLPQVYPKGVENDDFAFYKPNPTKKGKK